MGWGGCAWGVARGWRTKRLRLVTGANQRGELLLVSDQGREEMGAELLALIDPGALAGGTLFQMAQMHPGLPPLAGGKSARGGPASLLRLARRPPLLRHSGTASGHAGAGNDSLLSLGLRHAGGMKRRPETGNKKTLKAVPGNFFPRRGRGRSVAFSRREPR